MSIKNSNQTTPSNYRTSYLHSKKKYTKKAKPFYNSKKDIIKKKMKYLQIKKFSQEKIKI